MVGDESTDNDSDASEEEDKHAQVSEKLRRERLEASGNTFETWLHQSECTIETATMNSKGAFLE